MYSITGIANNIRTARRDRQYSQEYLSYKLKISQNAYSKIEQGITKLTLERIFAISNVLEVDVTDLISHRLKVVER